MSYINDQRVADMLALHERLISQSLDTTPQQAGDAASFQPPTPALAHQTQPAASWEDESAAMTDEGRGAEVARTKDDHAAAARYHAVAAREHQKLGNTSASAAHQRAASAHLRAVDAASARVSTAANIASADAHQTGFRKRLAVPAPAAASAKERAAQHLSNPEGINQYSGGGGGGGGESSTGDSQGGPKGIGEPDPHYGPGKEHDEQSKWHDREAKRGDLDAKYKESKGDKAGAKSERALADAHRTASDAHKEAHSKGGLAGDRATSGKAWDATNAAGRASEAKSNEYKKAHGLSFTRQSLDVAVPLPTLLDEKTIPDDELPSDLRGKGLIRGQRFEYFKRGVTNAKDGRIFVVDSRSVDSLVASRNGEVQPAPFDYSHRRDPEFGADTSGYLFTMSADPESVWVESAAWTRTAAGRIATGSRGFISPEVGCEPLHPQTYELLDETSPLYDAAADRYNTNTWRPMVVLGGALVPNPALPNIPTVTLSTDLPAESRAKGDEIMKLNEFLGLPATATKEQLRAGLAAKAQSLGITKGAKAALFRQALADGEGGGLDKAGVLAMFRKAYKLPDVLPDDMLCDLLSDVLGAEHDEPAVAAAADAPEPAAGTSDSPMAMGMPPPNAPPPAQAAAAQPKPTAVQAASVIDPKAIAQEAAALVRADADKRANSARVDALLLDAEKRGALVPARREEFRSRLLDQNLSAGAEADLRTMPTGPNFAQVMGTGHDPSISVDRMPRAQRDEILSRAAGYMFEIGCSFDDAFRAVRNGDKEEQRFHAQVLSSDPEWGIPHDQRRGLRGAPWETRVRRVSPGLRRVEMDADLAKHVQKLASSGAFDNFFKEQAARTSDPDVRRQFLSDVGNFQPGGRFVVPNMAFGVMQGDYAQPEICPDITGGVNEEVSIPIYSTEQLQAPVAEDGYPKAIAYNAKDIETTSLNVDFQKVTLNGSANKVEVDRRAQRASDAVLPEGILATATRQALTIEKNKREKWVSKLLTTAPNYAAGNQFDLNTGNRQWHNAESTPLQDMKKANVILWRAVGKFSEGSLIPPDVLAALQYHPDFIRAAQIAFQGQGQSGAIGYVPEALLAVFLGPIMVPTARVSVARGGGSADTLWGQNVILYIASKGEVIAPRAFANVVNPGYPIVKTFPKEEDGLDGVDVIKVSDMYAPQVIGKSNNGPTVTTPTESAFFFANAAQKVDITTI